MQEQSVAEGKKAAAKNNSRDHWLMEVYEVDDGEAHKREETIVSLILVAAQRRAKNRQQGSLVSNSHGK